ncbi:MAG: DNA topoisomerase IB [Nannocystaceae bacterium]|nr:DNA topoisomerase IB [bacterium]
MRQLVVTVHSPYDAYLRDDPAEDARRAGLLYVSRSDPGYSRVRCGRGFRYRDPFGQTVPRGERRDRFESLALPPAWRDVWICAKPNGHLQATGVDEAGRVQYRYHAQWRAARDERKFLRMVAFGRLLTRLRRAVRRDLRRPGLHRRRVAAACVRLLDSTHARIGHESYADDGAFGLCTLQPEHLELRAGQGVATLDFPGKSGRRWQLDVQDPSVVRVLEACAQADCRVFCYRDDGGSTRAMTASRVVDYLREASGHDLRPKDFRTWAGTVIAAATIRERLDGGATVRRKKVATRATKAAAAQLRNTPAVCRSAYIFPAVLESFSPAALEESRARIAKSCPELRIDEQLVQLFLERHFDAEPEGLPATRAA